MFLEYLMDDNKIKIKKFIESLDDRTIININGDDANKLANSTTILLKNAYHYGIDLYILANYSDYLSDQIKQRYKTIVNSEDMKRILSLKWEKRCPRNRKRSKKLYFYENSWERIKDFGDSCRHPHADEAFGLLIAGIEGRLIPAEQRNAWTDMQMDRGEWVDDFWERRGKMLYVYPRSEKLVKNADYYSGDISFIRRLSKPNPVFAAKIGHLHSVQLIELKEFPPEFIKFFYSRLYDELPGAFKGGPRRARISLPPEAVISPISRMGGNHAFNLIATMYEPKASRWVYKK